MSGHASSTAHYSPEYLAEDSGSTLIAISVLFIVLDTIFVALRFSSQRIARVPVGLDDFIIPFAWLAHVGLCILGIIMVREAGVGRHLAYIHSTDPTKLAAWAKSLYALEWLYLPAVALSKISILLLYLRIFVDRGFRIAAHILIWVLVANWIAYLVASSFQCTPFAFQWNKKIPGGRCFDQPAFYKTVSAPNIVTDVLMLLLPMKTLLELKVSRSRKVGVILIFLSGGVGIIASCIRMASFFQTEAFVDNTWASVKLVSWSIVEPGMYLMAACSVRLRPALMKFAEKTHLKNFYTHVSQKVSRSSGQGSNIRMGIMSSSHAGFDKMPKEASDHTSYVGNTGGQTTPSA